MNFDVTPQTFRDAAALLKEKGWTQNTFARDSYGDRVSIDSSGATCFCALGALAKAAGASSAMDAATFNGFVQPFYQKHAGIMDLVTWNDNDHRTADFVISTLNTIADKMESERATL